MNRKKALTDIVSSLFCIGFSAVLYFWLIPTQVKIATWNKNVGFTAQTFPKLLAAVMFISGTILLATNLFTFFRCAQNEKQNKPREKVTANQVYTAIMPFLMTAAVLGYYYLFIHVGFIISTLIIVPVVLLLLRCKKWQYYLYTYLFSGAVFLIFEQVLRIQLP